MRESKRREPIQVAAQLDPEKAKKPAGQALAAAPQRKAALGTEKTEKKKEKDEDAKRALESSLDNDARTQVRVHPIQFSPERHERGEISVGGAKVAFQYDAQGEETGHVLALWVPEGVRSVAVPIEIPSSALRVRELGAAGRRLIRIAVLGETSARPRVQVTFTAGTQTCVARFEL